MFEIFPQAASILLKVIGGLGIFMLGMKFLSEGIQTVAGPSLRRLIGQVTDNRLMATGTGTLFTLMVQSSSIATVVMVGLVNAGLMQLHQAVGFIMGANIGTTITGWILMFKVGEYGLPVLGMAALVYVFSTRDRLRFIAMAVMGLGMVFFGLQLMKDGAAPLKQMEGINDALGQLHADSYYGILICVSLGCLLTFLVQSSSAALAILVAAASEGLISFPAAAAFILGENIGTTITVVIASLNATTNAKRAALAHVLFNIIGVTWVVICFPVGILLVAGFVQFVYGIDPMSMSLLDFEDKTRYAVIITASIASVHTSFNIVNTCLFLPFVPQFARLLERFFKNKQPVETPHLMFLTSGSVESPAIGIEQSRREMIVMGAKTIKMMEKLRSACLVGELNPALIEEIRRDENLLDIVETEIVAFLSRTLQSTVSSEVVKEGQSQLRLAHELESIGDHLANITKDFTRLKEQDLMFSAEQTAELLRLHDTIYQYLVTTLQRYESKSPPTLEIRRSESRAIIDEIKRLRADQLQLIVDANLNPSLTLMYTGTLTHYRRIRGHILNSNQAITTE